MKRNGLVNNLTYTYDGNQLTKISDSVEDPSYVGAFNFRDGADSSAEYTYDANGSMTSDKNRGITSVTYNVINQPQKIIFSDGKTTEYVYGYDGTKLQTVHKTRLPQSSTTTTYSKNLIYEDGVLKRMLVDGGYVTFIGGSPEYHFFIHDHLGNNRIVATADGTVEQENHYYPYGGLIADICTGSDVQPYKYNGKELDRMHGLDTYDYGARQHNAATGRWDRMDRKCEKYYDISPYAYCGNNPVNVIDPDGDTIIYMRPIVKNGQIISHEKFSYLNIKGNYAFYDRSGNIYNGGNTYLTNLKSALEELMGGKVGAELVNELSGQYNVEIKHGYNGITGNDNSSVIEWDSQNKDNGGIDENGNTTRPTFIALGHEFAHAVDFKNQTYLKGDWVSQTKHTKRIPNYEKYACYVENLLRKENHLPMRKYYSSQGGKGYEPTLIKNKPYW